MRDSSIIRVSTWTLKFQDFYLLRKSYFRTERVRNRIEGIRNPNNISYLTSQTQCRVELFKYNFLAKLVLEDVFSDKISKKIVDNKNMITIVTIFILIHIFFLTFPACF